MHATVRRCALWLIVREDTKAKRSFPFHRLSAIYGTEWYRINGGRNQYTTTTAIASQRALWIQRHITAVNSDPIRPLSFVGDSDFRRFAAIDLVGPNAVDCQVHAGKPITIGNYTYLDGPLHVQLSVACDAIINVCLGSSRAPHRALICPHALWDAAHHTHTHTHTHTHNSHAHCACTHARTHTSTQRTQCG